MPNKSLFLTFLALAAASLCLPQPAGAGQVKVFILAGQSNMEGKAQNTLLEYQAEAPGTREHFRHLRKDGKWVVREDVWIRFLNRHGGLSVGFGSPDRTGAELEFGHVMGEHFDEPVLLIKTAWGGHSLFKNFRPPSAGLPDPAFLEKELEQARNRIQQNNEKNKRDDPLPGLDDIKSQYGQSYRDMLQEVKDTFARCETLFPQLQGKQLKLAGFVWFQGWNDMYGELAPGAYASNMRHFIRDVRRDMQAPNLPFVIGAMGQNGSKPAQGNMLVVQNAQLSMNDVPEFRGNVRAIRTDVLVDKEAERLIEGWENHVEEWKKVGSDRAYHYLGSALWFNRIGRAFGEAMLELMKG